MSTIKSNKGAVIIYEQLTEAGYLIRLIHNFQPKFKQEYLWEVHSIAPDGYKTLSDESYDRNKCEQTFKLLTEVSD